ncbi:MAG: hypothetical protein NTV30_05300, partial [Chloroflexi bacterium]|nr:hypothetical protein [Chloroflexota bacterium]
MIGSGLRNRLRVLLIGLVTIILVFACLLGCIEFVSQNARQDTSSNNLFKLFSNNNSTISPVSISSTISPESAKSGHTPLFKINNSEYISLLRSTVTTTYDGKNWLKDTDQEYTEYKQGDSLEKGDRSAIQIVYTTSTEVTPINMSSKGRSPLPTSLYVQDIYLPNNPDETLLYSSTEQLFYSGNGFQSYTF